MIVMEIFVVTFSSEYYQVDIGEGSLSYNTIKLICEKGALLKILSSRYWRRELFLIILSSWHVRGNSSQNTIKLICEKGAFLRILSCWYVRWNCVSEYYNVDMWEEICFSEYYQVDMWEWSCFSEYYQVDNFRTNYISEKASSCKVYLSALCLTV